MKTTFTTSRRELLELSPLLALGAFAIPGVQQRLLSNGRAFSAGAFAALRGDVALAPTFSRSDLVDFANFPVNSYLTEDPGVDPASWRLTVKGDAVSHQREYTLTQIRNSLPKVEQITRHICIEGWDAIGHFGGARLSDFLQLAGAEPDARFIEIECADDYYEFIEIAAARHSQTLLCYEMYGKPLTPAHGAPLRLQLPTKLGYKQAKHIVEMRVTRVLNPKRRGYWVDQGYPAYGGL
jgi:DMSO/TMAO reductase YedYZ molybdopterin-dependent catalytic subunit